MSENTVDNYLRWITPTLGDPTYSLLKAHLLFEDLIRAHLAKSLAHPKALEGARLTFVQLLAIARATSSEVAPDHWLWQAMANLNRLRNMLAHETEPKSFAKRVRDYVDFISERSKVPFPKPTEPPHQSIATGIVPVPRFTTVDIATLGLYVEVAAAFGFNVNTFVGAESNRAAAVGRELDPTASNIHADPGKIA